MKIHNVKQRTQEWLNLKLGVISGTRLKYVVSTNNLPLLDEMIAEEFAGQQEQVFMSEAMKRGVELESDAIEAYEKETFQVVEEVGFVECEEFENVGLSPDGLISIDGVYKGAVEIKCPSTRKHIEYIRTNRVPAIYKYQVVMYFLCVDTLEWLDFVTFDDRIKNAFCMHTIRVNREDLTDEIALAKEGIIKFNEKKDKYFKTIIENLKK